MLVYEHLALDGNINTMRQIYRKTKGVCVTEAFSTTYSDNCKGAGGHSCSNCSEQWQLKPEGALLAFHSSLFIKHVFLMTVAACLTQCSVPKC